jgi:hypothetical protein
MASFRRTQREMLEAIAGVQREGLQNVQTTRGEEATRISPSQA